MKPELHDFEVERLDPRPLHLSATGPRRVEVNPFHVLLEFAFKLRTVVPMKAQKSRQSLTTRFPLGICPGVSLAFGVLAFGISRGHGLGLKGNGY